MGALDDTIPEAPADGQTYGRKDRAWAIAAGSGDMVKSVYDTDDNGIVDNSQALEGNSSAFHLSRLNHTGSQFAATISDFDIEVSNNTDVAANTAHKDADGKSHSDVVLNNSHRALIAGENPHNTLPNVDNLQQIPLTQKGAVLGVAELDGAGTVPVSQLPNSVKNGIRVVGFWNASTNTPNLSLLTLSDGEAYQISVAGSTSLNGETNWRTKDLVVWEDSLAGNWFKIDNTDDVLSVAGKTGAVALDTDDVSEASNLYYTESRVEAHVFDSIKLNTAVSPPAHQEGLIFYDNVNKCPAYYNDESDSTLQIGQEVWLRGKNNTGSTILNGQLIYIDGNDAGLPTFTLAQADVGATASGTIAFATHDIENGTIGLATKTGTIRDLNTIGCSAGQMLWLSATTAGAFTTTQPTSPNFSVSVGNCGVISASIGTIEGNINASGNTRDVLKIFNGAILEDHSIDVSSNGTTSILTLEENGGGDLNLFFDGTFTFFEATPAASVNLVSGSDISPTLNYVFIPKSTGVLTANTSGFPTNEQVVPIAEVLAQSAASLQTDGCYKCHAWTDHLSDSVDQGHVSHVNKWIRKQHATWIDGVTPSTAITVNGGAIDNVFYSNISGNILQLHEHAFPAIDMSTGDPVFVVNDPTTAFRRTTDLNTLDETSLGVTLRSNNTYYSIVVWGVINEDSGESKIYANLPTGSYANATDAITDPLGLSNFTIPADFKGTGFLIARVVLRYQTVASGTITEISTVDLRGLLPSTGAGSSGGSAGTEFSDNLFRIQNVTDNTKEIEFDASPITTSTTRKITMPDADVDLGDVQRLIPEVTAANEGTFNSGNPDGTLYILVP